jgi:hypothetical protein
MSEKNNMATSLRFPGVMDANDSHADRIDTTLGVNLGGVEAGFSASKEGVLKRDNARNSLVFFIKIHPMLAERLHSVSIGRRTLKNG